VCVVNLSEHAFNSTQDLIELQRRLARGDVPDLALFLQGANDIWAAYSSGRPDAHGFLGEIAGKLERDQGASPTQLLLRRLAIVRLLRPYRPREVSHWTMPDTALADTVVGVYLENYRMLRSLARTYGFEYQVFWQPTIHTGRKRLVPEEEAMRVDDLAQTVPAWPRMLARAFDDIGRRGPRDGHFHDLRDAFDARTDDIYTDYAHVVPEGNRLLADRMLAALALPAVGGPPTAARAPTRAPAPPHHPIAVDAGHAR
jgi:lysophospholipase L1-like esterase